MPRLRRLPNRRFDEHKNAFRLLAQALGMKIGMSTPEKRENEQCQTR